MARHVRFCDLSIAALTAQPVDATARFFAGLRLKGRDAAIARDLRKKEIIIRAGSNISPLEVEEVLYQHPAGRECGVVGVPDPEWGEVIWAYVATRAETSSTVLQDFLQQKIAAYKVPEVIHFLPELTKGPTGEIHRRTLRERAIRERSHSACPVAPRQESRVSDRRRH